MYTIECMTKFLLVVLLPVAVGHLMSWVSCTENGCITDTELSHIYLNHTEFLCQICNRFIVFIGNIEMLGRRDLWRFYSKVTVKVGSNRVRSATAFFSQVTKFSSNVFFTNCWATWTSLVVVPSVSPDTTKHLISHLWSYSTFMYNEFL